MERQLKFQMRRQNKCTLLPHRWVTDWWDYGRWRRSSNPACSPSLWLSTWNQYLNKVNFCQILRWAQTLLYLFMNVSEERLLAQTVAQCFKKTFWIMFWHKLTKTASQEKNSSQTTFSPNVCRFYETKGPHVYLHHISIINLCLIVYYIS